MAEGSIWREFEHDPRDPRYAAMRAADRDRDVVHDVLAAAYADGRLDRDELDERTSAVTDAKTYGELLPPLQDLVSDAAPIPISATPPEELVRKAGLYYNEKLREAFFGFLIPNLICWSIWFLSGHSAFVWPIFLTIPTGANLARMLASRGSIVDSRVAKLERRARTLEPRRSAEGEAGSASEDP